MLSLSLVLLHVFFLGTVFFYFRKKINNALALRETENQLSRLVHSFNVNAEMNLSLMEEKEKSLRQLLKAINTTKDRTAAIHEKLSPHQSPVKKKEEISKSLLRSKTLKALEKKSSKKARQKSLSVKPIHEKLAMHAEVAEISKKQHPQKTKKKVLESAERKSNAIATKPLKNRFGHTREVNKKETDRKMLDSNSRSFAKVAVKKGNTSTPSAKINTAERVSILNMQGEHNHNIAKQLGIDVAEVTLMLNLNRSKHEAIQKRKQQLVADKFIH